MKTCLIIIVMFGIMWNVSGISLGKIEALDGFRSQIVNIDNISTEAEALDENKSTGKDVKINVSESNVKVQIGNFNIEGPIQVHRYVNGSLVTHTIDPVPDEIKEKVGTLLVTALIKLFF